MDSNTPSVSLNSLCPSARCQAVILVTDTAQDSTLPFDAGIAGQYFAASFITGITLYLISLGAGQILRMLR